MNRTEFVEAISEKMEGLGVKTTKKQSKAIAEMFLNTIKETLVAGETFDIVGFGKFSVKDVPEKLSRNPQTGEKLTVPAHKRVAFKAGKGFKDAVNS